VSNNSKNSLSKVSKNSFSLKGNNSINKVKKNNNNSFINLKKIEDFNNFSPEFYKNFYSNDDYFFEPVENDNIIKNQVLKNPNENEIYQGDINNQNQKHGFGIFINPDKKRIGTWKNDIFNGWGREIKSNGEIYEGKFENDKLNGKGIYKNGGILYIGDFRNYKKHGKGELFTNSYHYIGNFVNDDIEGFGKIEYYEEGVFEGNFYNNEINGYGTYKYKNGDFYEGQMKNGRMNGKGKLTRAKGKVIEGLFVNGKYMANQSLYNYNE
jgi:hypothetical protein